MYQYGTRRYSSSSHQSPVASAVGSQRLSAGPSSSSRSRISPAPSCSAENYTSGYRRLSHSNDSYSSSGLASRRGSSGLTGTTGLGSDYLRPTRYDSYYSRNNRYLSPSNSSPGHYLNGVSRDSSFSSSWPSPIRKDYLVDTAAVTSSAIGGGGGAGGYSRSGNYSSNPSISGFSSSAYRPSDSRSATPLSSSRRNSLSYSNNSGTNINNYTSYLDSSTSRLGSSGSRRYSGAGLGSSEIARSSSRTSFHNNNSYGLESGGRLSRSGSRTSFSPMPQVVTPLATSSSGPRTSWSKHYSQISAQWAENTNSHLTNKSPYNYRPSVSSRYETNLGGSSYSSRRKTSGSTEATKSSKSAARKREDSDGYDSSSSGDNTAPKSISTASGSGVGGGTKVKKRHRKTKNLHSAASASPATVVDPLVKVQITNHDDAKKSSSDEEPSSIHESVDARIKARRRRLQKSRNILQQQKEDSWAHRRALQIEECKQRTFEHLLSPMTEIERRQQERRGSKGINDFSAPPQQPLEPEPVMVNGTVEDSSRMQTGSPYNFNIDIKPFPLQQPTWRSNSADVKSSLSPSKSPEPSSLSLHCPPPEPLKIVPDPDTSPPETVISKRRDFNYNKYVSSIAPKKDHHIYDSPCLLLLETDQELLKQALDGKDRNNYSKPSATVSPVLTLDYRKSVSPRSLDSFKVDMILNPVKSGSADPANNSDNNEDLSASISITLPLQLSSSLGNNKEQPAELPAIKPRTFENNNNNYDEVEEITDEIFYFPLKLHNGKRIVISNVTDDIIENDHQTFSNNNNNNNNSRNTSSSPFAVVGSKAEDALCNVSASVSLTSCNNNNNKERSIETKNEDKNQLVDSVVKIAESLLHSQEDEPAVISSAAAVPQAAAPQEAAIPQQQSLYPVAKPRKSLEQKQSKLKLVNGYSNNNNNNDNKERSPSVVSSSKVSPVRDLSPKISAVILEEVKIDTAPVINTTIVEPTKKVQHSSQAKLISVVSTSNSESQQTTRKQPEIIEPKMSVVLFERQVNVNQQNNRKSKSPAKNVVKVDNKKEKSPTKLPVAQAKPASAAAAAAGAKTTTKLLTTQQQQQQQQQHSIKQKTPELKAATTTTTYQKQITPERKILSSDNKSGVKKQKTPERQQQQQQQKPETKTPTVNGHVKSDKAKSTTTNQPTVLKVVKKQTIEPETVIKLAKTTTPKKVAAETPPKVVKPTEKKLQVIEIVNQMLDIAVDAATTIKPLESKEPKLSDVWVDDKKSVSKSPSIVPPPSDGDLLQTTVVDTKSLDELIIVNGFHKSPSKEPSPALSHSETKISSGELVDHANGTKISVQVTNANQDGNPVKDPDSDNIIQKNKEEEEPLRLLTAVLHEPYTTAPMKKIESHRVYGNNHEQSKQSGGFKTTAPLKQQQQQQQQQLQQQQQQLQLQQQQQQLSTPQTSATKLVAQLKLLEEKEKLVEHARFYDSFQEYKRQVSQPRTDPSVYELHRLPSVDREMLQLLTLGDELSASRSSMHTAGSQTPANSTRHSPQWPESSSSHKALTADNFSWKGSKESLNSTSKLNSVPKPWRSTLPQTQEREGSIDSMSSFATAASHPIIDCKESSLPIVVERQPKVEGFKRQGSFEVIRVDMKGHGVQQQNRGNPNNSTTTVASNPNSKQNGVHKASNSSKSPSRYRPVNSLDQASKKIDEMLSQARVKQGQKIDQPPSKNFTNELDEVYEELKREYANEQQMRKNIRQAANGEHLVKKNVDHWQKDEDLLNKAAVLSPNLVENASKMLHNVPKFISNSNTQIATGGSSTKLNEVEFSDYDQVKMDYTKRWLEGDLKSLTRDPKPDLLQFDSQTMIEADQRSIGSASAEVAAITNREKLHALRVPDIVPKKHDIVKPSAVVSKVNASYQQQHQSEIKYLGLTAKPMMAQNYAMSEPCPYPNNFNNKQVLINHVRANDVLFQLEKNQALTNKREIGMVKKQVDMFDRMSDNDSERSFLSDNIAYKSALNRISRGRKVSLTDHIAGFIRKFESDEALVVGAKSMQQTIENKPNFVAEKADFTKVPPRRMHYSGGSTHSLPIIQPPVQMFRNYPASTCQDSIPGQWQKASVPWANKFNHGNQGQYLTVPSYHDDLPWSSNSTLADLDNSEVCFTEHPSPALPVKPAYLNKNYLQNLDNIVAELTLHTDDRQPSNYHRFPTESKFSPGRQLSGPVVVSDIEQQQQQQQPGGNFQRRQMLNVIPEYNEHYENIQYAQKKLEQARRELKQTSVPFMSNPHGMVHNNSNNNNNNNNNFSNNDDNSFGYSLQQDNVHPQDYIINQKRRSFVESTESNNATQNHYPESYVKYNPAHSNEKLTQQHQYQNYDVPPELPPRNQAPSFAMKQPPRHAQVTRAKHAQRASWHEPSFTERMNQHHDDDYDNISHFRQLNAQREPAAVAAAAALPAPRLHSPSTIKIGNIVLNKQHSHNGQMDQQTNDVLQQSIIRNKLENGEGVHSKNPIKSLFQMFNKTPKNESPKEKPSPHQRSDSIRKDNNALKGSSVSLNIAVTQSTRLPPVMHKSNSTNEAIKLRTTNNNNNVELQQLDDLLLAMQNQQRAKDQQISSNMIQDQTSKDQEKQKKFKLGWSLWKR